MYPLSQCPIYSTTTIQNTRTTALVYQVSILGLLYIISLRLLTNALYNYPDKFSHDYVGNILPHQQLCLILVLKEIHQPSTSKEVNIIPHFTEYQSSVLPSYQC